MAEDIPTNNPDVLLACKVDLLVKDSQHVRMSGGSDHQRPVGMCSLHCKGSQQACTYSSLSLKLHKPVSQLTASVSLTQTEKGM